jgi:thioredoxin reductase (NADPH)
VIGGGNSAVQEAFYLLKFCDKATLLVRSRLRCDDTLRERLEHEPRISVELGVVPTKIEQADQELSVISEDGRTFSAHNIFIFIGQRPATAFLPAEVLAEDNSVVTDKNYMTKIPGLFAAGDCRYESVHQVVTATGEGAAAAVAIRNYLK